MELSGRIGNLDAKETKGRTRGRRRRAGGREGGGIDLIKRKKGRKKGRIQRETLGRGREEQGKERPARLGVHWVELALRVL